jgi:hypothetical protein
MGQYIRHVDEKAAGGTKKVIDFSLSAGTKQGAET